jgi:hypothetical protein
MFLQVFVMFLEEIHIAEQNIMFTHCCSAGIFNCGEPTIGRSNQTTDA